jgi:hypothetical protein
MDGVCSRWLFCVKQCLILDTKPHSIKHGSGPRWVHSVMDIFSRMCWLQIHITVYIYIMYCNTVKGMNPINHIPLYYIIYNYYIHDIPIFRLDIHPHLLYPIISLLYSHDILISMPGPKIFQLYIYDIPLNDDTPAWKLWNNTQPFRTFLWYSYDIPMIFLWYPPTFLWYSYDIPQKNG